MRQLPLWLALPPLATASLALAQQSASYEIAEHTRNEGGNPTGGAVPSSGSFTVTVDALGDAVARVGLGSSSFSMDAGFAPAYGPPGEVKDVGWSGATTLVWDPERSVGAYNVYRGLLSGLPGGYGTCFAANVAGETTADASIPPPGEGYFYLVTAENRLGEEGTKGYDSLGTERPNAAPCP